MSETAAVPVADSDDASAIGGLALATLVALVLSIPLWAGGTTPGARALLASLAAVLLAVVGVSRCWRGPRPDRREVAWLAPWLAFSFVIALQLVPLPTALMQGLGAHPESFRALAGDEIQRVSPNPLATATTWASFTAYWGIAFVTSRLASRRLRALMVALLALALFESVYGLQALLHQSDSVLGLWARHYRQDATGTFINRNHFAGLLALLWPLLLGWLRAETEAGGVRAPKEWREAGCAIVSLLIGCALLASHSRFGLLAAGVGLATWGVLERRAHPGTRPRFAWRAWIVAAAILAGGVWLGGDRLIERLLELPGSRDRLQIWAALARLPWQTWILGAGVGSFADVFKTVHPPELRPSYSAAHSDWLEVALELGAVGLLAVLVPAVFWYRRVAPRRRTALQRGALAGLVAMGFHCLADFDLRIPGAAVIFWVSLGVAVGRGAGAPSGPAPGRRRRTLIVELWGLGDGAIASAALVALRPTGRKLSVVCKPATRALLAASYPGVEFIELTAPWTAFSGKYRLWRWPWRELARTLRRLRAVGFDEAVSVRPDPRDHLLMWLAGARTRCGFPRAGSGILLDAAVSRAARARHKVEDWQVLARRLTPRAVPGAEPWLGAPRRGEPPRADAAAAPLLVLHCGAGHPVRRWPTASQARLVARLRERLAFRLVVIPDSDGFGSELEAVADEMARDLSMDELVELLAQATLFLGNDSGPGHVAAALGVVTVTIFGPQEPVLFQPFGRDSLAVIRDLCPHRPCADRCRFDEPICLTRLQPDDAALEVTLYIEQLIDAGRLPLSLRRATPRAVPAERPIDAAPRAGG